MSATAPDVDSIDLSDLDWWTRPLDEREAAFAALRAERPLAPMKLEALPHLGFPETPYWSITRYADIVEASRHPELFGAPTSPTSRRSSSSSSAR